MQQLQHTGHDVQQHTAGAVGVLALQAGLAQLDVPVAEVIPNEVVQLVDRNTQLELLQVVGDSLHQLVVAGQDPLVLQLKVGGQGQGDVALGKVHQQETGGVPQLVGKVTGSLHLVGHIAHIVSGAVTGSQHKAQGVGTVLVDLLQGIHAVAQGLGHLATLAVTHQAVNQHGLEGALAGVVQTGEDHTAHPEADDVVAGDQRIGGIEIIQLLRVVGPTQGGEGPQGRGEPGIQRIGILLQMHAAALGTDGGSVLGHHGLAAVVAVPGGDAVTPPQLTGDTPVAGGTHPVEVVLGEALGDKGDLTLLHCLDGGTGQRLHLDEPLLTHHRLDGLVAAVAGAHVVLQILNLFQITAGGQILQNGLTALGGGHTGVLAAIQHGRLVGGRLAAGDVLVGDGLVLGAGHVTVVGEATHHRQVVTTTHLKVVGVMGGGDLHHAGTLGHIRVLVAHDGDFLIQQGQDHVAAVEVLVALVLGVDGHGGIAQHGLGTGGGQLQLLTGLLDGVQQVPEVAVLLLILHLGVGDGGLAGGTPVDHTVTAIDETLLVQTDEDLLHRLTATLVHGEALALPVTAGADGLQLADDTVAVLLFPSPGALQEAVAAQHLLGQTLGTHGLNHLRLGGDGCVVGAGHPQSLIALHTTPADEDILQGVVQSVTHVQLTGDVGRGHHDGVGLLLVAVLIFGVSGGVEIVAINPELIDALFHFLRLINLCQFFCHW